MRATEPIQSLAKKADYRKRSPEKGEEKKLQLQVMCKTLEIAYRTGLGGVQIDTTFSKLFATMDISIENEGLIISSYENFKNKSGR